VFILQKKDEIRYHKVKYRRLEHICGIIKDMLANNQLPDQYSDTLKVFNDSLEDAGRCSPKEIYS